MRNPWLIVGLGNPGQRYKDTRHSIGRHTVFKLGGANKLDWKNDKQLQGTWMLSKGFAGTEDNAVLALPNTFMNASGEAVELFVREFGVELQHLVVVCDDVNLPLGRIRVRGKGRDGGNLGLRSVIGVLGSQSFARVRIGIALPQAGDDLCDYVLDRFTPNEQPLVESAGNRAIEAVKTLATEGLAVAMDRFNGAPKAI